MTYNELLKRIQQLPFDRLHDTVTVYCPYEDEYISVNETDTADNICALTHALEQDQLFLILNS